MSELSVRDLEILLEAVEAWENKDAASNMMGSLLESMLTRDLPPEGKAKIAEDRRLEREKEAQDKRIRKETSILLRAKLLQILDRQRTQGFIEGALR